MLPVLGAWNKSGMLNVYDLIGNAILTDRNHGSLCILALINQNSYFNIRVFEISDSSIALPLCCLTRFSE